MMEKLNQVAEKLKARRYDVQVFATAKEAADFVLSDLAPGVTVAFGGSMTARQMGMLELLKDAGHDVIWHWEKNSLRDAMNAPAYLCSVNALTEDGLIVQIDGTGNRVAALCYGPDVAYLLVGRNKIVSGGYAQAVARIKNVACPQNARRLGLETPCATEGKCNVSACTKRSMCNVIAAFEHPSTGKRVCVVLINEDLGY